MRTFRIPLLALAASLALAACGESMDQRSTSDRAEDSAARAKAATAARDGGAVADTGKAAAPPPASPPDTSAMGAPPDTHAVGTLPTAAGRALDAQITARVNEALAAEKDLRDVRVDVDTQEGVVTLSGAVATVATRARITEVAKSVKDVRSVNDQLTLTAG